jgi:hypothetical protein
LMCVPKSILQTESYVSTVLHATHRDDAGCMLRGPRCMLVGCMLHVARRAPNGPPAQVVVACGFRWAEAAARSSTSLRPCAMVVQGGEGASLSLSASGPTDAPRRRRRRHDLSPLLGVQCAAT